MDRNVSTPMPTSAASRYTMGRMNPVPRLVDGHDWHAPVAASGKKVLSHTPHAYDSGA
jgi:hypothetical protein